MGQWNRVIITKLSIHMFNCFFQPMWNKQNGEEKTTILISGTVTTKFLWGKKINILFTFRLKNSKWVMLKINIEPLQTRKIYLKQSMTPTSVQHELGETRFTVITEPKATEDMWENSFEDTENWKRSAISALREGRTPLRPFRAPSARGL